MSLPNISAKFILDRQKFASNDLKTVEVYYVGNLPAKSCFDNAMQRQQASGILSPPKILAVSGWIIDTSQKQLGGAIIIPHWWNYNTDTNLYFDHTSLNEQHNVHYDYIIDPDLSFYYFAHQSELQGALPKPLIRRRGAWMEAVETEDGVESRALADLRTDRLFYRISQRRRAEAAARP